MILKRLSFLNQRVATNHFLPYSKQQTKNMQLLVQHPVRFFPRGIHKEQQLDLKKSREGVYRKVKPPVDHDRQAMYKEATSKEEMKLIKKGDTTFENFKIDAMQDAEMEKILDDIIDKRMAEGKTDEQILEELSALTGLTNANDALTAEQREDREKKLFKEIQ